MCELAMYRCPDTLSVHYTGSNIQRPQSQNIPRTHGKSPLSAPKHSLPSFPTPPPHLTLPTSDASLKFSVRSFSTLAPSTPPFSPPSANSPPNNARAPKTPWPNLHNSYTTVPLVPTPRSALLQTTCFSPLKATRHTCRSSKHAPAQLDTHRTSQAQRRHTRSLSHHAIRFSQAPPRPNLEHSFIKARKRAHYVLLSTKWGIPNLQHRWQPTTTQPAALPLTPSSRNGQKQLTCVFIGSAIEFAKDNSKSIGAKVRPIVPIIPPNIIPYPIIRPFDPRTCIRLRTPHKITSSVCPPSVEATRVR
jgi:hypothetical protein